MNTIYLDIETIPSQSPEYRAKVRENITAPAQYKKPDSIAQWVAENGDAAADELIAKTSFDPARGHICTIGFAIGDGKVQYYEMRKLEDEAPMLESFFAMLPTMGVNQFVGHYITGFDLRFILCRAVALGVTLPAKTAFPRDTKPWGDETFDTMVAWAGSRDRISQDSLCEALGLPCKGDFDGSMVAAAWAAGEHAKIANYCRRDVETVREIHKRFLAVGY
jgi:predicted PolB exonuclease-like 3'-5' exonuclease